MSNQDEGLKSEGLKLALDQALAGSPKRLEELLSRHGGLPGPKPNLKLAAAFGAEVGALKQNVAPLLTHLAHVEDAEGTAVSFLPVAAAHGWASRIRAGRDVELAWDALVELAADERAAVHQGLHDAILALALREGGADIVLERMAQWLAIEDREARYAAIALSLGLLADAHVMTTISDHEALFTYLSRVIEEMANAPRSAERSVFRRRTLTGLVRVVPALIAHGGTGDQAIAWLEKVCTDAERPDMRETLSDAIGRLRDRSSGQKAGLVDSLRATLMASAKPLRHAARVRPGTGRGKKTRTIR